MNPQEKFLDRMEQTFKLLNDHRDLVIWAIVWFVGIGLIGFLLLAVGVWLFSRISGGIGSAQQYLIFLIGLLYMIIGIIVQPIGTISFIKYISDFCKGGSPTIRESVSYAFTRMWAFFRVYYYIFLYAFIIPAGLLIVGLFFILAAIFNSRSGILGWYDSGYGAAGIALIGLSFFIGLWFFFYRGIRAMLTIYRAIDLDDYSKQGFDTALSLADNQWMRMFGNILGMSLVVGLVSGIFSGIIGGSNPLLEVFSGANTHTEILSSFAKNGIASIFSGIVQGLASIFSIAFYFLFFKRLELEKGDLSSVEISKSKTEETITTDTIDI